MRVLDGLAAIITGGGQGLGAAVAEHYVAAGASVMICGRGLAALEATQAKLRPNLAAGQKVEIMAADVAVPGEVDALVAETLQRLGRIDALVNNAGVYGPMGRIDEVDWQDWIDAIAINLMGTVYPSRAVLGHFLARGCGKIINISGGGATNPMPGGSAYAASKAAVVRFTETMALEVKSSGIDESFPQHRAELDGSDIYTLRRIVPKDRGMGWGNDP